jgi:hypothetical protein
LLLQQAAPQLIFLVLERPALRLTIRMVTLVVAVVAETEAPRIVLSDVAAAVLVVVLAGIMPQPLLLPVPQEQTGRT